MNIKSKLKQIGAAVLLPVLLVSMAACGSKSEPEPEREPDPLYPVTIDGTEILVGQTTVQTLLDKGLSVTVSEMSEDMDITHYEIDPDSELEANSYYTGGTVWVTDKIFAHISIATDEEAVRMGDATIARLEFSFSYTDRDYLDKITFNGIPISEMTAEKAHEAFPDFTGDDAMWFSPVSMTDYDYFMGFTQGTIISLTVEAEYDVDWLGSN